MNESTIFLSNNLAIKNKFIPGLQGDYRGDPHHRHPLLPGVQADGRLPQQPSPRQQDLLLLGVLVAVLGAGGEPGGFPLPAARAPLADNQQRVGEDGAGAGRVGGRTRFGGRVARGVPVLQPHEPAVVQRYDVGDVQV